MSRRTSLDAYLSIMPHASVLQKKILDAMTRRENATCEELEWQLQMKHQTVSARLNELATAGLIVDSGNRRTTSSGRRAIVWKVNDDGAKMAE